MDEQKTTKKDQMCEVKREKERVIPIQYFDDFPGHPFKVRMDEDMEALVESVMEFGILTPLLTRKTEQERYEIIAGHRRKLAAKKESAIHMKARVKCGIPGAEKTTEKLTPEEKTLSRSLSINVGMHICAQRDMFLAVRLIRVAETT